MQEQILKYLFFFLSVLTISLSLVFSPGNRIYLFVGLFIVLYWQRKKFRIEFSFLKFLLIGLVWAVVLELCLGGRGFGVFIFYLIYFPIWYKPITVKSLSFLQTFYLSGLFGVFFQAIFTKNLAGTLALAPDLATGALFLFFKIAAKLTVFGALTSLPSLLLLSKDKPL